MTTPICSKPQVIGGTVTALLGLTATAIATRLFKEKVTLVLAAGLGSTALLTGIVVTVIKPRASTGPTGGGGGGDPVTLAFPTKQEEVQAWLDHHGDKVAEVLKDSEAETNEKVELLGWMEDAKRMEVLKELNPLAEPFISYFDVGHDAEFVTWLEETKPTWMIVIQMKPELAKLVVQADHSKTGFTQANIASLMRKFGKEAPAIAATVANDPDQVIQKKAVEAYAKCETDNNHGYWAEFDRYFKDPDLCQSALDGLWGRGEFTGYAEKLEKLSDAELLQLFPGLEIMFCPDDFVFAVAAHLQDKARDAVRARILSGEAGTEAMLAFLIEKVDMDLFDEMNLPNYLEWVKSDHVEVANAALGRIRKSGKFDQWLPEDNAEALEALGKILKNGDTSALDTGFVDAVNSEI